VAVWITRPRFRTAATAAPDTRSCQMRAAETTGRSNPSPQDRQSEDIRQRSVAAFIPFLIELAGWLGLAGTGAGAPAAAAGSGVSTAKVIALVTAIVTATVTYLTAIATQYKDLQQRVANTDGADQSRTRIASSSRTTGHGVGCGPIRGHPASYGSSRPRSGRSVAVPHCCTAPCLVCRYPSLSCSRWNPVASSRVQRSTSIRGRIGGKAVRRGSRVFDRFVPVPEWRRGHGVRRTGQGGVDARSSAPPFAVLAARGTPSGESGLDNRPVLSVAIGPGRWSRTFG